MCNFSWKSSEKNSASGRYPLDTCVTGPVKGPGKKKDPEEMSDLWHICESKLGFIVFPRVEYAHMRRVQCYRGYIILLLLFSRVPVYYHSNI